jgi:FKBP-type peptidyl-prolyl cis-trans isomerase SlyD
MSKRVIAFHYTLTNTAGDKIDSSEGGEPLAFIEDTGSIIAGLERELKKLKVGDKSRIGVKAAEAYGHRDEKKVHSVPRKKLPMKQVKVGDRFRGGNDAHSDILTVTEVTDTHVTLDANHPLAGEDLTFDVEIKDIRAATQEELDHGHVHGAGGHHH